MAARAAGSAAIRRMLEASSSGLAGIGGDGESVADAQGGNVGLRSGDGDDGFSSGDDAEHFAGDDDAFEASLNGDDVGVGGGEDGGNVRAWEEWQEADVVDAGCQIFHAGTLGPVTDKNKSDVFVFEFARGSDDGVPRAVKT